VKEELSRLQAVSEGLRQSRKEIKAHHIDRKLPFSAFRKLPATILEEIFLWVPFNEQVLQSPLKLGKFTEPEETSLWPIRDYGAI
jgi:hypothetical protein